MEYVEQKYIESQSDNRLPQKLCSTNFRASLAEQENLP